MKKKYLFNKITVFTVFSLLLAFKLQAQDYELLEFSRFILYHTCNVLSFDDRDSIQKLDFEQKQERSYLYDEIYYKQGEIWQLYNILSYARDSAQIKNINFEIDKTKSEIDDLNAKIQKQKEVQEQATAKLIIELATDGLSDSEFLELEEKYAEYIDKKEQSDSDSCYKAWLVHIEQKKVQWEKEKVKRDSLKKVWEERQDSLEAEIALQTSIDEDRKDSIRKNWILLSQIEEDRRNSFQSAYDALSDEQKDSIKQEQLDLQAEFNTIGDEYFAEHKSEYDTFLEYRDSIWGKVKNLTREERDSIIATEFETFYSNKKQETKYGKKEMYYKKKCEQKDTAFIIVPIVSVYPNPTQEFIIVESDSEILSITILNSFGEIIEKTTETELRINGKKGSYIVNVETENGIVSKSIIKE